MPGSAEGNPLARVLWIGGGSCAGKSTLAERLATDHGFEVCNTDREASSLARRLSTDEAPLLHRFLAMDLDERWVNRPPEVMLETFHWFQGEGFDALIDVVRSKVTDRPLVVEGFHLLPRLVAPLLADRRRAVWLLPAPTFRATVLQERRASGDHFVDRTRDPDRAMANLLVRDHLFTERLRAETSELGLASTDVDGTTSVGGLAADLVVRFGLV